MVLSRELGGPLRRLGAINLQNVITCESFCLILSRLQLLSRSSWLSWHCRFQQILVIWFLIHLRGLELLAQLHKKWDGIGSWWSWGLIAKRT